jgi:hypothetical protein
MPYDAHVVAIAAGDLDGDGDDEVVLSHRRDFAPLYCENHGFAYSFNADPPVVITADPALDDDLGVDNHALPLVADLDLDGFADVVVADQTSATYSVLLRQQSSTPEVLSSWEFFQSDTHFVPRDDHSSRDLKLRFKFDTFPTSASKLQVVVWNQPDYANHQPPLPISHAHYLFALPGDPPDNIDGVTVTAVMTIPMADADASCFASVYWIEVRAVKDDSLTAIGPTYTAALVSHLQWGVEIAGSGQTLYTNIDTPACSDSLDESGIGTQRAPCVAPCRRMPNFGTGTTPTLYPQPPTFATLTYLD